MTMYAPHPWDAIGRPQPLDDEEIDPATDEQVAEWTQEADRLEADAEWKEEEAENKRRDADDDDHDAQRMYEDAEKLRAKIADRKLFLGKMPEPMGLVASGVTMRDDG